MLRVFSVQHPDTWQPSYALVWNQANANKVSGLLPHHRVPHWDCEARLTSPFGHQVFAEGNRLADQVHVANFWATTDPFLSQIFFFWPDQYIRQLGPPIAD